MKENPLQNQVKEITDKLEQGLKELFESEKYKLYLNTMSKFHNYSFNNVLLIAMQKPNASLVAGYNAWRNIFHRQVKKGEKAIKILAPAPYTIKSLRDKLDPVTNKPVLDDNGKAVQEEIEIKRPAFKVVNVFDVSQTEGKELPTIGVDELTGDVEKYSQLFNAIESISPVPVAFEKIEGGAHGYYHLSEKRIAIDEGMSQLHNLKTLIHEISHAKLHDIDLNIPAKQKKDQIDRRTREVEAESIAYTVCYHYGLDTSDYSFAYVAGWSSGRELVELKVSLDIIRSTASEMIDGIDLAIEGLQKNREIEGKNRVKQNNPPDKEAKTEKTSVLAKLYKKQEEISQSSLNSKKSYKKEEVR